MSEAYRVALPFKIGQWTRDKLTGRKGVVVSYEVHADLSVSAEQQTCADDGTIKAISFLCSRLEPCEKEIG